MGYLANFIVYTLAMVGVIVLALMVFKGATGNSTRGGSKYLKIQDTLSIGPRKTLYIISAGEEKFLIAGDVDKTCLISKLGSSTEIVEQIPSPRGRVSEEAELSNCSENLSFQSLIENKPTRTSYIDRSIVGNYKTQNKPYDSVMKNLAERIKEVNM